jgi:hypothetical protein
MADDLLTMKIAIDDRDYLKVQNSQKKFQYSLVEIERAYRKGELTSKQYNRQLVIQSKQLQNLGFSYSQASSQVRKYSFALRNATEQQLNHAQAMSVSGKGMRRFELFAQQAGYQIGDFAVQVQSGTNIAVAFGQQMSQLLGFIGPYGAIAGAGIAIGTGLIAPLLNAKKAAKEAAEEISELDKRIKELRTSQAESIGGDTKIEQARKPSQDLIDEIQLLKTEIEVLEKEDGKAAQGKIYARKLEVEELEKQLELESKIFRAKVATIRRLEEADKARKEAKEWEEGAEERLAKLTESRFAAELALLKRRQEEREKQEKEEQKRLDKINSLFEQRSSTLEQQALQNRARINNYNDEVGLLKAQQEIRRTNLLLEAAENDLSSEQIRELKTQLSILENQEQRLLKIKEEEKDRLKRAKELSDLMKVTYIAIDPESQLMEMSLKPSKQRGPETTKTKKAPSDVVGDMLKQVRHQTKMLDLTEEERRKEEILFDLKSQDVKMSDKRIDQLIKESEAYYKLNEERDKQQVRIDQIGDAFGDMLMNVVDGTMKADEAFKSFMSSILKQLYQEMAIDPAVSFLKSFLADGGVMSRGRLTAFANGGVVNGPTVFPMANGMGLMGEAGPEAIMPLKRGPDGKLGVEGGGGVTVVQNINVSTGVQQTVRTEIKSLMPQIAEASKAAVADAKRRGGSYGRNFA